MQSVLYNFPCIFVSARPCVKVYSQARDAMIQENPCMRLRGLKASAWKLSWMQEYMGIGGLCLVEMEYSSKNTLPIGHIDNS